MARTEALSRSEVCSALHAWGDGKSSDAEMHIWATNNYFPAHQAVAPGEPSLVAISIGIVLTEFECAWPPYAFGREVAATALALINSHESNFDECKEQFYKSIVSVKNAL